MVDVTDLLFYGSLGVAVATCLGASLWFSVSPKRAKPADNATSSRINNQLTNEPAPRDNENFTTTTTNQYNNRNEQQQNHLDQQLASATTGSFSLTQPKDQDAAELLARDEPRDDEVTQTKPQESIEVPKASGQNICCVQWVNDVLSLLYTQHDRYSAPLCDALITALNEKLNSITNASPDYCDLIVECVSIRRDVSGLSPKLSDINVEFYDAEKAIVTTYKMHNPRLLLELVVQRAPAVASTSTGRIELIDRDLGDGLNSSNTTGKCHYELAIENLEGSLKSHASLQNKMIVTDFISGANFKISIESASQRNTNYVINEDSLINMIAKSISQSMVVYYYGDDPDFPPFIKSAHYQHHQHQASLSQQQQQANQLSGGDHNHHSTIMNKVDKLTNQLREGASELGRNLKQRMTPSHLERKALVKIIRAQNINYNQNVTCLLELVTVVSPDQAAPVPPGGNQMQVTSTKKGSSNPHWDEHFIFNLNPTTSSSEKSAANCYALSIELWDDLTRPEQVSKDKQQQPQQQLAGLITSKLTKSKQAQVGKLDLVQEGSKSLGSAQITLEEMRANPMQKISLKLKSPEANDNQAQQQQEAGELLIELTYMEHSSSSSSGVARSASGTSLAALAAAANYPHNQSASSTLEPYSNNQDWLVSVERRDSRINPAYLVTTERPNSAQSNATSVQSQLEAPANAVAADSASLRSTDLNALDAVAAGVVSEPETGGAEPERQDSRRARRSKSFLDTLRSRLPFRRSRSIASASRAGTESATGEGRSLGPSRLSTSELSLAGDNCSTIPNSREPSEVPAIVINRKDSASLFKFKPAQSQLVFECIELVPAATCLNTPTAPDSSITKLPSNVDEGDLGQQALNLIDPEEQPDVVVKYYAINDDKLAKKWRHRGTKLHFFNEHQFLACHLASSSTCHNCGRVFSRRPGKQGYKCRNCDLLAHKQCHTKVEHQCPYSPGAAIKLEFVNEEPGARGLNSASNSTGSRLTRSASLRIWPSRANKNQLNNKSDNNNNNQTTSSNLTINRFASLRRLTRPSTAPKLAVDEPDTPRSANNNSKMLSNSAKSISMEIMSDMDSR